MSRSITSGVFGAAVGLVAAIVGILWVLQLQSFMHTHDFAVLLQNVLFTNFKMAVVVGGLLNIALNNTQGVFTGETIILSLLLIASLILTGAGLYGIGKAAGSAVGTASLVIGIVGTILSVILLAMGVLTGGTTHTVTSLWVVTHLERIISYAPPMAKLTALTVSTGVPTVGASYLWAGLLVLGVV
ncbi:MAG: hypothetical protein ACTSV0_02800, partial [Candidatus Freyarchaeota archaeon]